MTFSEPAAYRDGMGTQVRLLPRLKPHMRRDGQVHLCSPLPRPRRQPDTICLTTESVSDSKGLLSYQARLIVSRTHKPVFNSQGLSRALINCQVISPGTFLRVLIPLHCSGHWICIHVMFGDPLTSKKIL